MTVIRKSKTLVPEDKQYVIILSIPTNNYLQTHISNQIYKYQNQNRIELLPLPSNINIALETIERYRKICNASKYKSIVLISLIELHNKTFTTIDNAYLEYKFDPNPNYTEICKELNSLVMHMLMVNKVDISKLITE